MSNKVKVALSILAVVCVCAMIFLFSSQTGTTSQSVSNRVASSLHGIIKNANTLYIFGFPIRKVAHFTEYALLGVASCNLFMRLFKGRFSGAVIAFIFCVLWAAGDEIHQFFVPGRAGLATDVVIDSLGSITGIILFVVIVAIFRHIRKKKREAAR